MSDAVLAAFITGLCAVIAQIIISKRSSQELYTKLEEESKLADARLDAKLEKHQAVTDTKIDNLTREVRSHNGHGERLASLETKVATLERKVS